MDKDNNRNKKPGGSKNNGDFNIFNLLILGLVFTVLVNMGVNSIFTKKMEEISYDSFVTLVKEDLIKSVQVKDDRYLIELKEDVKKGTVEGIIYSGSKDVGTFISNLMLEQLEKSESVQKASEEIINRDIDLRIELISNLSVILARSAAISDEPMEPKTFYTGAVYYPEIIDLMLSKNVNFRRPIADTNPVMTFVVDWVLPFGFIYFLFYLVMRSMSKRMGSGGSGFMNIGKSSAKMYNMEKKTGITFDDVAGQEEAKESLTEIIDFLHHPEKYAEIGAKQPKGALLVGPPGTGKTLLAKAVAGEANVPFFSLTGSEFVEMYVGVGASRVRDLFKTANQHAPCIIFIDEIDAIGKSRDNQIGGNDEREQTLNQLLSEMDGFDTSKGIVILAATNRPEILDKALLRPGRFDRRVIVEKPDLAGREAILLVHARKVKLDEDVSLKQIALATSGAAGADLANMINEAALRAVRLGRNKIKQEDLMEAVEVVIAGKEKKDRILSMKEKRLVAFHEVGHALAAALQKNTQPVQKITIVPRTMGSLGYVMQMPEEEKFLMTKEEFLSEITVLLGGRAAEEIMFNTSTTGASNDIERATKMARSMVAQYGMSDTFGVMGLESIQSRYLDGRPVATCSSETEAERDKEIKKILDSCYEKAVTILRENKEVITAIAEFLLKKESISGEEFMTILKEQKPDFVERKPEDKKE
ncbi:ATP-dependent zinc metalloprotease FtsH [Anaeropeptidivorans aminofermentans]|uniref:ATP-dependent zinc metalloprotease FtsH n=1 Tax=Anaeropeptidivorans aminofermentans TaxID=2934315 RepID=UPI00202414C9|nr:ATP-dependent zinc metalloprotease FtsH [Anaeropeptidivorans aminofermentans]